MTKVITALLVKIADPSHNISHQDVASFTPHQMIHLLQQLVDKEPLPIDKLQKIGQEYKVNENTNTEIKYRYITE